MGGGGGHRSFCTGRLRPNVKPLLFTVESRFNKPLYNEDPGITNGILQLSDSKMYGKRTPVKQTHYPVHGTSLYRGTIVIYYFSCLLLFLIANIFVAIFFIKFSLLEERFDKFNKFTKFAVVKFRSLQHRKTKMSRKFPAIT